MPQYTHCRSHFSTTVNKKQSHFKFITISTTLKAWWKTLKITNSSLSPCKYTPIWHKLDFQLHNSTIYFPLWHQKGITHHHHLFVHNSFMSFSTIIQRDGVEGEQFLQYQQLKNVVKSKTSISENTFQPSELINNILNITSTKKITSKLYKIITSSHQITLPSPNEGTISVWSAVAQW